MKITLLLSALATWYAQTGFGQCENQVQHLTGTATVNGVVVSVTSSGVVDTNTVYCDATFPYFIGYNYSIQESGNGSYSFNFSPAITGATLNFSGISVGGDSKEEVRLFVNGTHYQIPSAGSPNGCDALASLTPEGNIAACSQCSVSGWNGTHIDGPIYSLTVLDTVLGGEPAGSIFSLFICGKIAGVEQHEPGSSYRLYPNPFSRQATLQTDYSFRNATLIIFNACGRAVKRVENISGRTITLDRDDLPGGMYYFHLTEDAKLFAPGKFIIAGN